MSYEWLALTAAFLWSLTAIISVQPAQHLGTFAYNRWRMAFASLMLSLIALINGGWQTIEQTYLIPLICSGLVGIFIGDTALFACLNRMGPRRSGLLFSCNAVFSTILGYLIFDETMSATELTGALAVFCGVGIAIFFRNPTAHQLENITGSIWIGLGLGLLAALGQSLSGIIAKPVMVTDVDPFAASAIRMIAGFIAHGALLIFRIKLAKPHQRITPKIMGLTALNSLIALTMGMTLIMMALKHGHVGTVALLSSTTPIILLPVLWIYTKQRPHKFAWLGAIIAVCGSGVLVYH